jgi:hypothetical protein
MVPSAVSSLVSSASVVGFSGSRSVVPAACAEVVPAVSSPVFVGCARGVDAAFRAAFPSARVFLGCVVWQWARFLRGPFLCPRPCSAPVWWGVGVVPLARFLPVWVGAFSLFLPLLLWFGFRFLGHSRPRGWFGRSLCRVSGFWVCPRWFLCAVGLVCSVCWWWLVGLPAPRCAVVPLLAVSWFGWCPRFFRGLFVAGSLSADRLAFAPSPVFSGRARWRVPGCRRCAGGRPCLRQGRQRKKFRPRAIETSKF